MFHQNALLVRFLQGKSEKGELETRFKSDSDKEKPTKKRHQKLRMAEAMYEGEKLDVETHKLDQEFRKKLVDCVSREVKEHTDCVFCEAKKLADREKKKLVVNMS